MIKKIIREPYFGEEGDCIEGWIGDIVEKINEIITILNIQINYEEPECVIKKG